MRRRDPVIFMDPGLFNLLKVPAYLIVGAAGIAWLVGWALKWFGPPNN